MCRAFPLLETPCPLSSISTRSSAKIGRLRSEGSSYAAGITAVVDPTPHWAEDLRAFRLETREYCRYADWLLHGARARFFGHADLSGDEVMLKARAMVAREIAEGLWD